MTTNHEQIIAEAKEADPGFSPGALIPLADSIIGIEAVERLYNISFAAGAASRDAEVAELVSALRLWKLASNNSEESELDDMACYCVPMPLFCDADEATEAVLDKAGKL